MHLAAIALHLLLTTVILNPSGRGVGEALETRHQVLRLRVSRDVLSDIEAGL